jgi:hypothetical protein
MQLQPGPGARLLGAQPRRGLPTQRSLPEPGARFTPEAPETPAGMSPCVTASPPMAIRYGSMARWQPSRLRSCTTTAIPRSLAGRPAALAAPGIAQAAQHASGPAKPLRPLASAGPPHAPCWCIPTAYCSEGACSTAGVVGTTPSSACTRNCRSARCSSNHPWSRPRISPSPMPLILGINAFQC